jgi:hypothetical protein
VLECRGKELSLKKGLTGVTINAGATKVTLNDILFTFKVTLK